MQPSADPTIDETRIEKKETKKRDQQTEEHHKIDVAMRVCVCVCL